MHTHKLQPRPTARALKPQASSLRTQASGLRPQASGLKPAFTLVEMLVVIGIVAILAALLLPAVNRALVTARNTAISIEVNQLATAIEAYKQDKGDYPPNFRSADVFLRHVRKCYPKIDQTEINTILDMTASPPVFKAAYQLDEGEALVFWLSLTRDDPRFPFGASSSAPTTFANKKYYDFDETRKVSDDGDNHMSYRAKYCKDTNYVYIDSRSYLDTCRINGYGTDTVNRYAYADDTSTGVRPYWSNTIANSGATLIRDKFKPVNATTFQIICAGQDGEYGYESTDNNVKVYPDGSNYNEADKDNITNFSNGRPLNDAVK